MNRTVLVRRAALVVAIVVIVGVGAIAYHAGVDNSTAGAGIRVMPFRGRMMGWGDGSGAGIIWLVGVVVVGLLFVWLLAALLSPGRGTNSAGGAGVTGSGATGSSAGELDTLKGLSDLHAQGRLTDEEFTAAKRKLLGLQ
jgi:hypothetical protein